MIDNTLYPHEVLIEWVWKGVMFLLKPFIFLMVMALTIYISGEIMTAIPRKDRPKYARYTRYVFRGVNTMIDNPVIHLWSPYAFHEESYIVGNREGLVKLYQEIGTVLNKGKGTTTASFFISDGEGYDMVINLVEDKDLDKIAIPYTASYAEEKRQDAVHPWDIAVEESK